jgi:two-component system, LuxR family, response regulator FixJ
MKNAAPAAPVLILVVDDDEAVRDAVCDVVTMLGYTAEPASDARAVLDGFRPGLYDLVVTDLAMPIMNGLELARRLRALDPTLPITIFSATALPAEPSMEVTGLTVARKPDVDALTRLIQRALGRS